MFKLKIDIFVTVESTLLDIGHQDDDSTLIFVLWVFLTHWISSHINYTLIV